MLCSLTLTVKMALPSEYYPCDFCNPVDEEVYIPQFIAAPHVVYISDNGLMIMSDGFVIDKFNMIVGRYDGGSFYPYQDVYNPMFTSCNLATTVPHEINPYDALYISCIEPVEQATFIEQNNLDDTHPGVVIAKDLLMEF